jgi:hypothetical protein
MSAPADRVPPHAAAVSLAGRGYMAKYGEIIRRAAASPADEFDQGAEPGERIPLAGAHQRIQRSFHGGAGQEFYDEPDSDRSRFWRSRGMECRVPGKLCLATTTSIVVTGLSDGTTPLRSPTAPGPFMIASANGATQYVYFVSGTTLRRIAGPDIVASTSATITSVANPTSLATFGGHVYAACGSELRRTITTGTTSEVASNQDCDLVGYANGHLLIGHDDTIYEILDLSSVPAAATALWTNPEPGDWTAIAESPGAIYAAYAADSGKATIFSWVDVSADSTLAIPVVAAPLNDYEIVHAMLCVGRVLCLGTSEGVRVCAIAGDGSLDVGPIIQPRTPDQHARSTDAAEVAVTFPGELQCHSLAVIGADLYVAGERSVGADPFGLPVYRLDLGDFVGSLQPAYENWGGGASSVHEVVALKAGTAGYRRLAFWQNGSAITMRLFQHLPDPTVTQTTFERYPVGNFLQTGWITFGKVQQHQPIEVVLYHDPIPAGGAVGVHLVDAGLVKTELTGTADGATATRFDATTVAPGRKFRVDVQLTRGTTTTETPVLNGGWSYRGQVLNTPQDEIIVTLVFEREYTGQGRGQNHDMDPYAEYTFLKALEGTITDYGEGGRTETVQVASVGWERGDVQGMDTKAGQLIGALRVRMVTVR